MSKRRRARRLVIQGLCCLDVQGRKGWDLVVEFIDDSREPAETIAMARELLERAYADRGACDEMLARHARRWDLSRLALVDRNILRLATCELREKQTPFKVVISEAIALAKEFSSGESPRFVNGVLDAVAREISRDTGDARDKNKTSEAEGEDSDDRRP